VALKDENGRKRTENRSTIFVFVFLDGNGSGSRTAGSENGSGINGNTKTGKYDRKIDETNGKRKLIPEHICRI
jgi:hypothetical protein